jgi:hypothetical protein
MLNVLAGESAGWGTGAAEHGAVLISNQFTVAAQGPFESLAGSRREGGETPDGRSGDLGSRRGTLKIAQIALKYRAELAE